MQLSLAVNTRLQDGLAEVISRVKADYAEIRAEEVFSTEIVFRGEEPEAIVEPETLGFFVRVLVNGSWATASFTDISQLKNKISQIVEFAKLQSKGHVSLAENIIVKSRVIPTVIKDFRDIPLKNKVAKIKKYNNLLLKSAPGIQSSVIFYNDSHQTKFYANSEGSQILQVSPYVRLSFQAIGKNDGIIEVYRGSKGHIGGFEIIENLEENMVEVSKEASELPRKKRIKSGIYTVILDPLLAGTFAHEAFGHLSEADHQYENPELLNQMASGNKIGSDQATIIDDPWIRDGWGNLTYDDEGVLAKKVNLITRGVITGRLHSRETAAKLGEMPNGRARADGFEHRPIVRMSNTYFEPGKETLKKLITSTKSGVLAINWTGGMTAMESFTFTPMYGVMIENGKLTEKVRGLKLTGNVFETLKNIEGVSSDFAHDEGTCGKGGQSMPVGSGGGYVKILNVAVGGE